MKKVLMAINCRLKPWQAFVLLYLIGGILLAASLFYAWEL